MELIYCWIDELYANSQDIGLNFSGEYNIKYLKDKKKLEIKNNLNYIEGFFNTEDNKEVKNITGIVGKNGAGKSSILDYIKSLFYDGGIRCVEKDKKYNFYKTILIMKEKGKLIIFISDDLIGNEKYIECDSSIEKEIIFYGNSHEEEASQYHIIKEYSSNKIIKLVKGTEILQNMSCVYMTNIFDMKYPKNNSKESIYYDLSTNGILDELEKGIISLNGATSEVKYINERPSERSNRFNIPLTRQFKLYKILQQLRYISESKEHFKDINDQRFKLPSEIIIRTDHTYKRNNYIDFLGLDEPLLRYENKDTINKLESLIYKKLNFNIEDCKDEDTKIKFTIYKSFIIRIIDSYWWDIHKEIPINKEFDELLNKKLNSKVEDEFINQEVIELVGYINESVLKAIDELKDKDKSFRKFTTDSSKYKNEISDIKKSYCECINLFEDIIFKENDRIRGICYESNSSSRSRGIYSSGIEKRGDIIIDLKEENLDIIKKIIDSYIGLNSTNDFIVFEWRNISSGEYSLLDTYSKLYSIKDKQLKENIILLVDEGELYLHPEWQRQYMKILVEYTPKIFKGKNIQIIFSSNSPFLISDIPRDNIVTLDKIDNKIVLSDSDMTKQTFGANISSLLNNSFFIKNSMGDFAKDKIEKVIEILRNRKGTHKDKEYIKKVINLIDDPIIKKKLEMLYNEIYGDIDEQIRDLKYNIEQMSKKIKELEQASKKGDLND